MKPCRKDDCKRVAKPESPWCAWHFAQIVTLAYSPKNEAVAAESYLRRQFGR